MLCLFTRLYGYIFKSECHSAAYCYISGITRFQFAYNITFEEKTSQYPFEDIDDMSTESQSFDILIHDGMKLDIQIRASDITNTFADDFVTVKTDLSPPVIVDLWLTKGDRLNISVHNIEDLSNLQYVCFYSLFKIMVTEHVVYMCIPILANCFLGTRYTL